MGPKRAGTPDLFPQMTDPERLAVATFVLLLLGGSYIAAVNVFAREYLLVATVAYLFVAILLLSRLLKKGT